MPYTDGVIYVFSNVGVTVYLDTGGCVTFTGTPEEMVKLTDGKYTAEYLKKKRLSDQSKNIEKVGCVHPTSFV